MPADDQQIAETTPAKPRPKTRLLSLDDLDGRTNASRYARQTHAEVLSDLGGPERLSTLEKLAADHVSVIDAMIRDVGIRWLRGDQVDPTTLSTLVNTFNRSASALGWKRRVEDLTPSIDAVAAQIAGAKT